MTKFKRLASIAMVGCIMGSMLEMNANAVNVALTENNEASSTSIITIFEYEKALQEAGKPYGIEVEVLDYNPNIKLTQEMLNNAVRELQEAGSTITITDLTPLQLQYAQCLKEVHTKLISKYHLYTDMHISRYGPM